MDTNLRYKLSLALLIQLVGIAYLLWFISRHGYLPTTPFVVERDDSFMDLFNPLYWADNPGRYTVWHSVYPPINFIFLKAIKYLFIGPAIFPDSLSVREAGFSVIVLLIISYLVIPIFVVSTPMWAGFNIREKFLIYLIFILSIPMLFALERGNLIILAPIFLALMLSKSNIIRIISIALLINLKPYFALLLFYYALTRNWKGFALCSLVAGLIFFVTGIFLDPYFFLFFPNLLGFSHSDSIFPIENILALPSSISAISYAFNFEAAHHINKYTALINLYLIANLISAIQWAAVIWLLIALTCNHKNFSDSQVLTILVVVITNLGIWVGGYSLITYFSLLPVFFGMRYRRSYLIILFLIFAPLDFIPLSNGRLSEQYSFITNSVVDVSWSLGLGSIMRPFLNFLLMLTLLHEVRHSADKCPS